MASPLSRLGQLVARASGDLQGAGVRRWALAGGIAVGVRCEPRFTRDVDVVVGATSLTDAIRPESWSSTSNGRYPAP